MEVLRTYEDHLRERGFVTTDRFVCGECKQTRPAFAFVERKPNDWVCTSCYVAEVQAAETAAVPPPAPWETLEANGVRAIRNQMQDKWRWAVMPDSPLHADAQTRVMQFLKLLNTLTIDYPSPEDVIWPIEPTINGEDYEPDA